MPIRQSQKSNESTHNPSWDLKIQEKIKTIFKELDPHIKTGYFGGGVPKDCADRLKSRFEEMMRKEMELEEKLDAIPHKLSPTYFTDSLVGYYKKSIKNYIETGKIDQLKSLVEGFPEENKKKFTEWKNNIEILAEADKTQETLRNVMQKNQDFEHQMSQDRNRTETCLEAANRESYLDTQMEKRNYESVQTTTRTQSIQSSNLEKINVLEDDKKWLQGEILRLKQELHLMTSKRDEMASKYDELRRRVADLKNEILQEREYKNNEKSRIVREAARLCFDLKNTESEEKLAKMKFNVEDKKEYDEEMRKLSELSVAHRNTDVNDRRSFSSLVTSMDHPDTDINYIAVPRFYPTAYLAANRRSLILYRT